jgi:hypothetical protein
MGHYIRFIHNRDLAVENIMTACVRHSFLLSAPPGELLSLYQKMISLGLPVPPNSALVTADQRRALHASLPGEYGLLVNPTRRNHRKLTLPVSLRNGIKRALFPTRPGASARYKLANNEGIAFSAGIKLNGRDYIQGNSVEYVPYVQRRGNALGAGGLDGSSLCVTTTSHTRTQTNIHTHTHTHARHLSRHWLRHLSFVTSFVTSNSFTPLRLMLFVLR